MRRDRLAFLCVGLAALFLAPMAEPARGDSDVTTYVQLRATFPEGGGPTASVRRLKVTCEGELGRDVQYLAQGICKTGNASATDNRVYLQDALIRVRLGGGSITIGQFKPPFGLERFTPDWDLDTIDRAIMTDSLVPNGKLSKGQGFTRDYGVQWEASLRGGRVSVAAGLFTGHGANAPWLGISPLVAGRVDCPPG